MTPASGLGELFPLPDGAKQLQRFLGSWKVVGALETRGKTFEVEGTATISPASGGWGVLLQNALEFKGLGTYLETGILGYDIAENAVHFFALTNTSAVYDHKGAWFNDRSLRLTYEGRRGAKLYRETLKLEFRTPDELVITEEDTLGGKPVTTLHVRLTKAPQNSPAPESHRGD